MPGRGKPGAEIKTHCKTNEQEFIMPIDNDPVSFELKQWILDKITGAGQSFDKLAQAEQRVTDQVDALADKLEKLSVCSNCGEDIGQLVLADVAIKYGELVFCDTVCHDEWLDAIQDKIAQKYDNEFDT